MKSSSPALKPVPRRVRKQSKRLRRATILGTGVCVPERVVENKYFSEELGLDTTPEWIETRIGIVQRHWATDESSTDLAVGAARSALQQSKLEADEIDVVIVATSTPDFTMPSTACLVQGRLGATRALAFDIVDACSGYAYALDAASRYLQNGDLKNALVIGVDRGSRLVDHCGFHKDGNIGWIGNCTAAGNGGRTLCASSTRRGRLCDSDAGKSDERDRGKKD